MKKKFFIILVLMLSGCLVLVLILNKLYVAPEPLEIGEKLMVDDYECVIEEVTAVPLAAVWPLFDEPNDRDDAIDFGKKGVDMVVSVKNNGNEPRDFAFDLSVNLGEEKGLPFLLALNLQQGNFEAAKLHETGVIKNDLHPSIIIQPNEMKQLHLFYIFWSIDRIDIESKENVLLILSMHGEGELAKKMVQVSDVDVCDQIRTEQFEIEPIQIYQSDETYGLTVRMKNLTDEKLYVGDHIQMIAMIDDEWRHKDLKNVKDDKQESEISEYYLEAGQTKEITFFSKMIPGNNKFYVRIGYDYYTFVL